MSRKYQGRIVLIIEDDTDCRNFVSKVLELEGYDVLQVKDGGLGIKITRETSVVLILLDLRLPGCDGWSVLNELKSNSELSEIPVIMLTASAEMSKREMAMKMGATGYLLKPFGTDDLRRAIANVLLQEESCYHAVK